MARVAGYKKYFLRSWVGSIRDNYMPKIADEESIKEMFVIGAKSTTILLEDFSSKNII